MRKNRIILFYPRPSKNATNLIPLNLMGLARMLDPQLYNIEIINATSERNYVRKTLDKAREGHLLCLGVTCMTGYQICDALKVTQKVKRYFPHIPIVWGGYHPTVLPLETIKDPTVDIVVKGQGEVTFQELIKRLSGDLPLESLPGVVYKTPGGEIKENVDRPLTDLNQFPPLPWHLVDINQYKRFNPHWGVTIDHYTSQGCPFNCGFCAEPVFCKRHWKGLNAERVVEEIRALKDKYALDTITIRDSNFFVSQPRVENICKGLIEKKVNIKLIGVNARIDTLISYEDEIWSLLYTAGFRELLVGAESGDQTVLDMLDKKITVRDIFSFLEKAAQHNLKIWVSLMMGLPGLNNKVELKSTLRLIDNLLSGHYRAISEIHIFKYTPYPGSPLYETSKDHGFIPPSSLKDWGSMDLFHERASWMDRKYSKYVTYLAYYILPRLINPYNYKNPLVKFIYKTLIDPIFIWRWRNKYFDVFVEKYLIGVLNYIGKLKYKLRGGK